MRSYGNLSGVNLGEERGYLEKNKFAKGPFPDSRGLVAAMREATPPELQYLVTDMFESIVLFENQAQSAVATLAAENKFKVTLVVDIAKKKADGSGNETPMAINDLIGQKNIRRCLHMEKRRFNTDKSTLEFVVDEKPMYRRAETCSLSG